MVSALLAGLAAGGCGGRSALSGTEGTSSSGASDIGGGTLGVAGTTVVAASGAGGSAGGGRATGGSGGVAGAATAGAATAGAAAAGASGVGGGSVVADITKIAPTPGCGTVPPQTPGTLFRGTIQTMGIKAPDCADKTADGVPVCGPWSYLREYYVTLPLGYQSTKAYPLVVQGPGCGGTGVNGYPLNSQNSGLAGNDSVDNTVIRVGLTPPPNDIGHATNPNQGCFDESEGDDSVEWPFYEKLYDQLAGQLCFDKNRVFANGSGSGGGRFVDELACKYAGDAKRPIRGVISNSGDWSTNPQYLPTCTTQPMAGMWVHEDHDPFRPWSSDKLAIARAMMVDHCTIGAGYDDATFDNFPIGGGNPDGTCKRIKGCSELTPLVVCLLSGNNHTSHDSIVNPGASAFIKLFQSPPLLSQ